MSDQGRSGSRYKDHEVELRLAAERLLVRPGKSARHIDLAITAPAASSGDTRSPLSLALVVDRSGSMQGSKLATAKAAAMAVLERLESEDHAAVVVFDSEVETILAEGPMTKERKAKAKRRLAEVEARASTALHQGWLTGCRAIAADTAGMVAQGQLSRCFLLTDGLANIGLDDPEAIAAQAAEVRANTGIGTSTFGIGDDYDEGLLAPMAVAGSGQFHHLRDETDIAATFSGELAELFNVTARGVRVELEFDPSVQPELISLYRSAQADSTTSMTVDVGDLIAGESRHLVLRLNVLGLAPGETAAIRARVVWRQGDSLMAAEWSEIRFTCADHTTCDAEPRIMPVMHWVGLHHAERAKKHALDLHRQGDGKLAIQALRAVMRRLREYAKPDQDLVRALDELGKLRKRYEEGKMTRSEAKEQMFNYVSTSRMQRDLRSFHK